MRHRSRRRWRRVRDWFRPATTPNRLLFPRAIGSAEPIAPDPEPIAPDPEPIAPDPEPTMMVVTGLFDWDDDRSRVLPIHLGPDADRPPRWRPNRGKFR